MKTLSDFNFNNKRVLLRADLNSDVLNGRVLISERIKASVKTISELKKKKARIVIISHQGRPGKDDFLSLRQHSNLLNKYTKVRFIPETIGKNAINAIKNIKSGEAILLENLRFLKDEFHPEKKDNNLVKKLFPLFDIYVNDAFSACHRNQTPIVSFPKYLKSCAGRLLESEINAIKKINLKKTLFILGGAKPEDDMKLLKGNEVLACGLFGQLCVIAKGKNLGFQNKFLKDKLHLIKKLKTKLKNVETPVDFAVKINNKRKEFLLEEFPSKYEIFDIGKKTIEKFKKKIKKAKSVYMKGPAGFSTEKNFSLGTRSILNAITKSRAFSVIGGGHLSDTLERYKISKNRFNYVSLSGGALLRYLAGEKLPGLDALK